MRYAVPYLNRNRLYFYGGRDDFYLYDSGCGVDGVGLVEDEVADAVEDGFAVVFFNGL